jgi:hypothetical protein
VNHRKSRTPDDGRITREQLIRLLYALECDGEAETWERTTLLPEHLVLLAEAVSLRGLPSATTTA